MVVGQVAKLCGNYLPRHPLGKTNTSLYPLLHFRQPSSNGWSGVCLANAVWLLAVYALALSFWLLDLTLYIPSSKWLLWLPYALEMPSLYDSYLLLTLVCRIPP